MADLVLALDTTDAEAARRLLDRLPDVRWVKLGAVLFTEAGPPFVTELKTRGLRVFLDLKWHDIPATVRGAVLRARALGVDLATVHTLGGVAMMAEAKAAAAGVVAVVGVTVLTSHDDVSFSAVIGREAEVGCEVVRLAQAARAAGLDGVVASPLEVARLRQLLGPGALIVTPGVRPPGAAAGDQARTATARVAASAGADLLVVGRPVLEAADPRRVWDALAADLR
jgi:orotidine-5'-phosphate decarboxylase